jgi:hypothetical protein
MGAARFEGSGPVARYWLANCEGFRVRGGLRGTVEELLRDADPHVTTRIVVRTRGRRRAVVPVAAVSSVVPAERLVVLERPRTGPSRPVSGAVAAGAAARRAASATGRAVGPAVPAARSGAAAAVVTARRAAGATGRAVAPAVPAARSGAVAAGAAARSALAQAGPPARSAAGRLSDGCRRAIAELGASLGAFAHELRASALLLVRSVPQAWRQRGAYRDAVRAEMSILLRTVRRT